MNVKGSKLKKLQSNQPTSKPRDEAKVAFLRLQTFNIESIVHIMMTLNPDSSCIKTKEHCQTEKPVY